jgi:hypothetical protein
MLAYPRGGSGAMSTIAIVILVAIGLVIMMHLNLWEEGSALASYIVAMGVLLAITVVVVRKCQGSF